MRSSTTSIHNIPSTNHAYSPTVPLSVYRELAAELQAKEAMLDSSNAQNQHLAYQNRQLRQEINIAVQSVLRLQQVANPNEMQKSCVSPPADHSQDLFLKTRASKVFSEKVFVEQEEGRYRYRSEQERPLEISGWRLAIAILLILATAFGAGYLIVRPLLQSR